MSEEGVGTCHFGFSLLDTVSELSISGKPDRDAIDRTSRQTDEVRNRLMSSLRSQADITGMKDLFDSKVHYVVPSHRSGFQPIAFRMKVPLSIQKVAPAYTGLGYNVEEFRIVYDGSIMMVASEGKLGTLVNGFRNVHERLEQLLQGAGIRVVSNITETLSTQFVLVRGRIRKEDFLQDTLAPDYVNYVQNVSELSLEEIIPDVFMDVHLSLEMLYDLILLKTKADLATAGINSKRDSLLLATKELQTRSWFRMMARRKNMKSITNLWTQIIDELVAHSDIGTQMSQVRSELEDYLPRDFMSRKLMASLRWDKRATTPLPLDEPSVLRVVDHVRDQFSAHIASSSAITAAIVGSVVTFILTTLLLFGRI